MIDKEIGPQEAAGRKAELNEGDKSLPDLPLETKRKFNGHGKGSWNEEAPGRPRWTSDTTPVDEYEYRRADGSHAFFIGKGVRPDGEKVFSTRRANCISFGARLEPEDKFALFSWPREQTKGSVPSPGTGRSGSWHARPGSLRAKKTP